MNKDADTLPEHTDALQRELDRRIRVESSLSNELDVQQQRGVVAEEMFHLLVDSVRDYAIFMLDPTGRVATWNVGAQRIKGYAANEIIGRHFSAFYPEPDVLAGKCELVLEGATRDGRIEDEGWRVRKDGTRFWANVVISAVHDRTGALVGFAKVTRDMTARKHEQDERLVAEERFRLLVENVQDYAIFMLDVGGNVASWNSGAERINGYTATDIIGRHFSTFYPAEDVAAGKCERELDSAARNGRYGDEGWRVRKDGTRFWANVVICAIRDHSGELVGFSKVTRDLTQRERAEQDRAARHAAEQASEVKDAFLAMLGHELRNPLAPIVTALQLIKLRGDTRSMREHQIIDRQVRHMMRLVDDLLDVSRITRGKIELRKKRVDLRDVIASAIEIAGPLFEQKRHDFDVDVPRRPITVDGDEARLTQVFANLLTNAAKYTEAGGHIALAVSYAGTEVRVDVRDDGVGIRAEMLPQVFDLFVQGPQTPERSAGGLGLGLTLVRALVDMHGGRVDVRSDFGAGSTFSVWLPAVDTPPAGDSIEQLATALAPATSTRKILIVDDNEDARLLLCEILATLGHEVRTTGDGVDALDLVATWMPDVAILDIGLPVMDGYELAMRLRQALGPATPRLVALTGYGQPGDQERSRAAGFAVHLVKPVDMRRLLDSIS